jgi:hypothetical protein
MGRKLEEIGREFFINNYSPVSVLNERAKQEAITDRKLKLPVAPPLSGGISAKTQADKFATLQQAHGESSKCKEFFSIVIRSLIPRSCTQLITN